MCLDSKPGRSSKSLAHYYGSGVDRYPFLAPNARSLPNRCQGDLLGCCFLNAQGVKGRVHKFPMIRVDG